MQTPGRTLPTLASPVLMIDLVDEAEAVITVRLPHLHVTETLRALSEWSLRYSLNVWQLSYLQDGASCSLLLQMVVPYRSPSSLATNAQEATAAILKNLRQHWSRYGAKVNVDVVETVTVDDRPAIRTLD